MAFFTKWVNYHRITSDWPWINRGRIKAPSSHKLSCIFPTSEKSYKLLINFLFLFIQLVDIFDLCFLFLVKIWEYCYLNIRYSNVKMCSICFYHWLSFFFKVMNFLLSTIHRKYFPFDRTKAPSPVIEKSHASEVVKLTKKSMATTKDQDEWSFPTSAWPVCDPCSEFWSQNPCIVS